MKDQILKLIYRILRSYARKVILRHKPFVVAITGSVGKTTTKDAVAQVMKDAFPNQVRATAGNLNAEIGIPLTILGYTSAPSKYLLPFLLIPAWFRTFAAMYPKYLVLEMGVEHKGDIEYFGTIVTPDIGIITAAEPAHTANFSAVSEMQAEKTNLAKIIKTGGPLIYNADDKYLAKTKFKNAVSYSIKTEKADCSANNIKLSEDGMNFDISYQKDKVETKSRLIGEHLIYADLAAFCLGRHFDISGEKIALSLEKRLPARGRMNLLKGKNGTLIIDDTYNSNPASARAALKTLHDIKYTKGRKVAIIGNMNELGDYEKEGHRLVGECAKGKADLTIFVGPNAEIMAEAFGSRGEVIKLKNRQSLEKKLDQIIEPNDLVLVKASQNQNYFEEISKELLEDKNLAEKVLVRQEKHWRKKKKT